MLTSGLHTHAHTCANTHTKKKKVKANKSRSIQKVLRTLEALRASFSLEVQWNPFLPSVSLWRWVTTEMCCFVKSCPICCVCEEEGFLRRTPWERRGYTGRLSLMVSSLPEQTAEGAEPAVRRGAPLPGNPSIYILPM